MPRQIQSPSNNPVGREASRPTRAAIDVRWLLLGAFAGVIGYSVSGHAAGASLYRAAEESALPQHTGNAAAYARGHILVSPKTASFGVPFEKALERNATRSLGKIGSTHIHVVDVTPGDEEAAVARLSTTPMSSSPKSTG